LDVVGFRGIVSKVFLHCFPDALAGLGGFLPFGDFEVPPSQLEGRVALEERIFERKILLPHSFIEGFEGCGEAGARVKVDGESGRAIAAAKLLIEFLRAGPKARDHGAVDVKREVVHPESPRRVRG